MPKVIAELRPSILERARTALLDEGYGALTMRGIAKACGVAVGTVYNYFPSKDMLVASVMLEDWRAALRRMEELPPAPTAPEALENVFRELTVFCARYGAIWKEYTDTGHIAPITGGYHHQLVDQLAQAVSAALAPFTPLCSPALPGFLAEALLNAAPGGPERFRELSPIWERLLSRSNSN